MTTESADVTYRVNDATQRDVLRHLAACDGDFCPPLHTVVDLDAYAEKISMYADRFEAWSGDELVGLVAIYLNDEEARIGHITDVSVVRSCRGRGVARHLLEQAEGAAKGRGFLKLTLEVYPSNSEAVTLYRALRFKPSGMSDGKTIMSKELETE